MLVEDLIHRLDVVEENIKTLFSDDIKQQLKTSGLVREFEKYSSNILINIHDYTTEDLTVNINTLLKELEKENSK